MDSTILTEKDVLEALPGLSKSIKLKLTKHDEDYRIVMLVFVNSRPRNKQVKSRVAYVITFGEDVEDNKKVFTDAIEKIANVMRPLGFFV